MHEADGAGQDPDGRDPDGDGVAASLDGWLGRLTFTDLPVDEVTARLIDAVAEWATGQGWRVYRRAPSVMPLPPPLSRQHSVLDVACARPSGPPVVVEIDHADRRRTVDKLVLEAQAGRVAIWVRWGGGRFRAPPSPVHMVTVEVVHRGGVPGQGRLYTLQPVNERPPPVHSTTAFGTADAVTLPIPPAQPGS